MLAQAAAPAPGRYKLTSLLLGPSKKKIQKNKKHLPLASVKSHVVLSSKNKMAVVETLTAVCREFSNRPWLIEEGPGRQTWLPGSIFCFH